MLSKRYAGRVNDQGELILADPSAWRLAVARNKGRDVWVTMTRKQAAHTMSQQRYYFGVVVALVSEYIGETREDTHELLKQEHLPKRQIELLDERMLTMPPSTRGLTVEQYTEYIERCRVWSAQFLGLSIPDANQVEVRL